ncbi:MAG TPA: ABC transporter C-terminal domain-containing protein, partial [Bacillota bacterium]|nr:ABC transporter C-terminal domain-containing protein [Bacillota bacterium]
TRLSYKEQREYEELEAAIDALQQELNRLQQEQAQAGSDYVLLNELHLQAQELEAELEAKMERWLELQELKEEYENA